MSNLPNNLPALLRAAGLTVVEVSGWQDRHRPGLFAPVGVLNHHTGSSAKGWSKAKELAYAKWMFLTGRSDLPAPLCQIALGRSATVYIGAAGRANHAGKAKASGTVGAGDGNKLYVGIEWMLSGTEAIPAAMLQAGQILNAVLTEKVTKTSVQTISCHYNTSVTGKWDIGDPSGIAYKGHKVLDVPKFRAAVAAQRARLYKPVAPKPPVTPPRQSTNIRMGHLSMQFSDPLAQRRSDAEKVFARAKARSYVWITGTEAFEQPTYAALTAAAAKYGYRFYRHAGQDSWIAVRESLIQGGWTTYWEKIIDGQAGKHTAKGVHAVTFQGPKWLGKVTIMANHMQGKPSMQDQPDVIRDNKKINAAQAAYAAKVGGGTALVFYGGDQNEIDNKRDTFDGAPFTSVWDEIKRWPSTGHGCIDVIASYDPDTRVKAVSGNAFPDSSFALFTDHFLIEAVYKVLHI